MQVPRSVVPAVLLVVAMIVVPLVGVAAANAVRPVIAAEPAITHDPAGDVPAMPVPPATARPLSTWFERLPVVELGPDAAPRPFVERYRAIPVGDAAASAKLIDTAFAELAVATSDRAVTRSFLDALILPTDEDEDPDADPDAPVIDPFETDAFTALSSKAMTAIAADPANATAVNDLAVAIVTAAFANSDFVSLAPSTGRPIASSLQLRDAAIRLFELGLGSFPGDRAMTINLAYVRSLAGDVEDEDATDQTTVPDPAIAAIPGLQEYVDASPTDATARSLLATLLVRADSEHGLDRALTIAKPLIDAPDTEAAGRIIRADTLLFAAEHQRTKSPFLARSTVRRALDDYDQAIGLTGDAAAYAGRARALDLLGARDAAAEAQREAVRLAPTSLTWRLRLAQLDGCAGDVAAWRGDAQDAFALSTAGNATTMAATRYDLEDFPDRTYGRYSIGSDLPTWDVTIALAATGSTIAALDPFPAPDTCATSEPTVLSGLDDAATEAVLAAIAAGDLAGARDTLGARHAHLPVADDDEDVADPTTADAASIVLDALAGTPLPEDDESVGIIVPLASRLPPAAQARFCQSLSDIPGLDAVDADLLVVCAAESIERTGDHAGAEKAIEPAVRLSDTEHPMAGTTALQAGILSELSGHLDVARTRYEAAATYEDTSIAGLLRLGDLDLREGDATGALDHYALADAAIRTQQAAADGTAMDDPLAGRIGQYIDNNRGIALLMTARTGSDTPPDCAAFATVCHEAGDAFAAAIASDPLNPVYPMNAAWVARLTGDGEKATALLTEALEKGTPLVAAANNDLGVLAAGRGDLADARTHFVEAIANEPDYDLATWNLGVLDSRQAGPLLVAGQASLADATKLNHDLLTDPVALQADERVYRIEVSGTQLELARAPGTGAAVGAAAFGAIAAVGAIGQLLSGIGGDVQDAAESVASEGAGRAGRRLRGIGGRFGRGGGTDGGQRWPSWAAWIPAIVVLTVTTAWTAAWMAPDAFVTAVLIGLVAAGLSIVVHACGHLVVAGRFGATLRPSGWTPGLALALVGMPFHVPAGPFLAERIETGDPDRDWWVSIAGVVANLAAAGVALLIYLAEPMPFLRILIATQLAVAAFSLIPSDPLDGERLATRPIVLALLGLGVAAASAALAVGAI